MPYDLGDSVRLTAECRDAGGSLADASAVTLTVTLPDGTTATPTVAVPTETGLYAHDYATAQAGRHSVRWVFTDPATAHTDVFDVRPAVPPLILSLTDAKAHLNITSTTNDDELRAWIESVTDLVEQYTGITVRQTFTETYDVPRLGARALVLRRSPVLSLTAVSDSGTDDVELDADNGIIRRPSARFSGLTTVTYVAGRTVIPASITAAAKVILQHLWRTQRGSGRGPVRGDDESSTIPGFGYSIPNRALQLMEPHRLPPGVG